MWIKKQEYKKLKDDSGILQTLIEATYSEENRVLVVGDFVFMPLNKWESILEKWCQDQDAVIRLTADKNSYKQKYEELLNKGVCMYKKCFSNDGFVYDNNDNIVPPTHDDYEYWKSEQDAVTDPLSDDYCKYDNE